jgi:hypothetical protein
MIASITINPPGVRAVLSAASPSATVRFVGTQGPAGAASVGLPFAFVTPALTWVINHNLGVYPAVDLRSLANKKIGGDVEHASPNQVVVSWAAPTAGYARIT